MSRAMGERPSVDIVVPAHNEQHVLAPSIERLHDYLAASFPFDWRIVIAENGSTDATGDVARSLAQRLDRVTVVEVAGAGRGRALRTAWTMSRADVVAYTDVDLSTGLTGLLPLVAPLLSGHSDVSIGSRLSHGSVVARGPRREIISRLYNLLLRVVFAVRFRDAQCGFKALRGDVAKVLLPLVRDDAWFFDTELLLLAEHNGLRVHELPVDWVDDPDSRVDVGTTALADLHGVLRVLTTFLRGGGSVDLGTLERKPLVDDFGRQTVSFAIIGGISTLISLGVFIVLRPNIGALWANAVALVVTAAANSWANRRWTFRRRGVAGRWWAVTGAVALFLATLGLSTLGLLLVPEGAAAELVTVLVCWGLGGLLRFTFLRSWVYRQSSRGLGIEPRAAAPTRTR
jgi:glycosyltransferase involved in cell wall biosynthesis